MTTWFSATSVVPELRAAWNLTNTHASWLTNGVQIGFVVGALFASLFNLPDIMRLNRLMAGASACAAVANSFLLLEPGLAGAFACRFATGMALAGVYPSAVKLVATWFLGSRGLALGAVVGALTLGSSLPHLFRAFAAQLNWQLVIGFSSLAGLAASFSFLLFAREGPFPFGRALFNPRQIGVVLRDRNLLLVNIGYLGHMWELYAMWTWLLIFVRSAMDGAFSVSVASLITFAAIGFGFIGCVAGGLLSDRFGRCATTAGFMIVSAVCAALIGFAFDGPAWLIVLIVIVWGTTIIGDSPIFSAAVTELADNNFVGTALSLQMGLGFALTVFVIWLMPQIADLLESWKWVFLILAPGPLVGAWAMLRLRQSAASLVLANGRK